MTHVDLRARLEAAGWEVVDLPGHHAMAWTAIRADACITERRDGTVHAWVAARSRDGRAEVQVTGHPAEVYELLCLLGVPL